MNHLDNKHDEWDEEKKRKREAYKKGISQRKRDDEKSTGNSGSGKTLTLSLHMKSTLCTDCGMSQSDTPQTIGICNQSK